MNPLLAVGLREYLLELLGLDEILELVLGLLVAGRKQPEHELLPEGRFVDVIVIEFDDRPDGRVEVVHAPDEFDGEFPRLETGEPGIGAADAALDLGYFHGEEHLVAVPAGERLQHPEQETLPDRQGADFLVDETFFFFVLHIEMDVILAVGSFHALMDLVEQVFAFDVGERAGEFLEFGLYDHDSPVICSIRINTIFPVEIQHFSP